MTQLIFKQENGWLVNMDYQACDRYCKAYRKISNKIEAYKNFREKRDAFHDFCDVYDDMLQVLIDEWDTDLSVRNKEYEDYSNPNKPVKFIDTKEKWIDHQKLLMEIEKLDLWAQLIAAQNVYQQL